MKKNILIIALVIECCVVFFLLLKTFSSSPSLQSTKTDTPPSVASKFNPQGEKNKWRTYMQRVGGKKAYKDFTTVYNNATPYMQHNMMHQIGALLYELYDIEGVALCDETFQHGCYHGFFGEALPHTGIDKIETFNKKCSQLPKGYGSCQHGIGHGILVHLGHDKLVEALYICDTLPWHQLIGGCKMGVFMEYNFSKATHDLPKVRPFDPSSPYSPCAELDEKYQYSCYFEQADWWDSVYEGDYKKISDLCEELSAKNKEACYLGAGNVAVRSSRYNIPETLRKCNDIPSTYGNILCKAEAKYIYDANVKGQDLKPNESKKLCSFTQPSSQKVCLKQVTQLD